MTNKGLTATKKGNTDKGMEKYSKILRVALNMGRKGGEVTNFSPLRLSFTYNWLEQPWYLCTCPRFSPNLVQPGPFQRNYLRFTLFKMKTIWFILIFQPWDVPLGIYPARVSECFIQHLETLSSIDWIRTGQHAEKWQPSDTMCNFSGPNIFLTFWHIPTICFPFCSLISAISCILVDWRGVIDGYNRFLVTTPKNRDINPASGISVTVYPNELAVIYIYIYIYTHIWWL